MTSRVTKEGEKGYCPFLLIAGAINGINGTDDFYCDGEQCELYNTEYQACGLVCNFDKTAVVKIQPSSGTKSTKDN